MPPPTAASSGDVSAPGAAAMPPRASRPTLSAPSTSSASPAKTTLPPRQHIRCFECGYEFNLTGRMTSTYCPKCRTTLDLAGYTIDAATSETLKTLGTIRITRRGAVSGAHLLATTIDLSGRIKDSLAQAFDALIIRPGADFVRKEIVSSDLYLDVGAEVKLNGEAAYRNVEILGRLSTDLFATGTVTIRAGAIFRGSITGGHLIVEDGAAVQATLNVCEDGLEKAKQRFADLRENPPFAWAAERVVVAVPPEPPETTAP